MVNSPTLYDGRMLDLNATANDSPDAIHVKVLTIGSRLEPLSEANRFASLVAGIFSCMCCSVVLSFNLITFELRTKYQLSQDRLSSIYTVGFVFCYAALPYGALFDWLGPKPVYILCFTLLPIGSLCFGLAFSDIIEGSVVTLCVFNALIGAGAMMFDIGAVITVTSLFPSNRGFVVAVMKTFTGLGSGVLGCIKFGFFEGYISGYFYFIMFFTFTIGLICFLVIELPPYHLTGYEERRLDASQRAARESTRALYLTQSPPKTRFVLGIILVVVITVYLPMQTALVAYMRLESGYKMAFSFILILLLLLFPVIFLPLSIFNRRRRRDIRYDTENRLPDAYCGNDTNNSAPLPIQDFVNHMQEDTDSERGIEVDVDYIAPQYQTTFLQSLCTLRFWAIFWTIFTFFGTELVIITNSGLIFAALSEEPLGNSLNTLLTVLNGFGSGVGRLMMSALEVWSQKSSAEDRIPITVSLFIPTTAMIIGVICFVTLPAYALPIPYIIASFGNGFGAALILIIARTLFAKDVAKHYGFCFMAVMLSAILLNRLLYSEWYTREAAKQGSELCYGQQCVLLPFLYFLGLNVSAVFSNIYVHLNYSRFCLRVLEKRQRLLNKARHQRAMQAMQPRTGEPEEFSRDSAGASGHYM